MVNIITMRIDSVWERQRNSLLSSIKSYAFQIRRNDEASNILAYVDSEGMPVMKRLEKLYPGEGERYCLINFAGRMKTEYEIAVPSKPVQKPKAAKAG